MQETLPIPLPYAPDIKSQNREVYSHHLAPFESVISNILNPGDSKVIHLRRALGETSYILNDEQIEVIANQFQFLIDSWLDEFEKEIFKGLTLKEVINNQ